jgi:hypothetical protein
MRPRKHTQRISEREPYPLGSVVYSNDAGDRGIKHKTYKSR